MFKQEKRCEILSDALRREGTKLSPTWIWPSVSKCFWADVPRRRKNESSCTSCSHTFRGWCKVCMYAHTPVSSQTSAEPELHRRPCVPWKPIACHLHTPGITIWMMSKQLWFEGLSHSIGQVEENKEESLSASLYPQYRMNNGASPPFPCPSFPLPFLTNASSCSCWKIEKVSERAVAHEILKQKCHVQIPLTLGALSSSPGIALLSAACLHRLCIRSAKIAMWEWGRAQITLIPLSSHSSAVPKAFTLQ